MSTRRSAAGKGAKVDRKFCRKTQGVAEPENSCLTTPGTCESCPDWSRKLGSIIEVPVEVMPDGSLRNLTANEVKAWRKQCKNKMRDRTGEYIKLRRRERGSDGRSVK